jgi:hypothetical protein
MNQNSRKAFFEVHKALRKFEPKKDRKRVRAKVNVLRAELREDLKIEDRGTEAMDV